MLAPAPNIFSNNRHHLLHRTSVKWQIRTFQNTSDNCPGERRVINIKVQLPGTCNLSSSASLLSSRMTLSPVTTRAQGHQKYNLIFTLQFCHAARKVDLKREFTLNVQIMFHPNKLQCNNVQTKREGILYQETTKAWKAHTPDSTTPRTSYNAIQCQRLKSPFIYKV